MDTTTTTNSSATVNRSDPVPARAGDPDVTDIGIHGDFTCVSTYAEAVVANVANQIRGLLFATYWKHGTDIGHPEVLRTLLAAESMSSEATSDPIARFGYAVAMTREPITTAAWHLIGDWREDWEPLTTVDPPEAWTSLVGDPWRRAGPIRRAGLRR